MFKTDIDWMLQYLQEGWGVDREKPTSSDVERGAMLYFVDIIETFVQKRLRSEVDTDNSRFTHRVLSVRAMLHSKEKLHGPMPKALRKWARGELLCSLVDEFGYVYSRNGPKELKCPPKDHPMRPMWDEWVKGQSGDQE